MPNFPPDTEEIWRTLRERLRQFLHARLASPADVDDVLQTTFLRILQNIDRLRATDRLESWVFQIARNAAADHYRRRPLEPLDAEAHAPEPNVAAENLNPEAASCLDVMIARLPANLQRAVLLYEREGLSQQEIAEQESISLSGAKSRVQRGRKQLKQLLEDCCRLEFDRFGNVLAMDSAGACDSTGGGCRSSSSCGCEGAPTLTPLST